VHAPNLEPDKRSFVGRQPILDAARKVWAYEILYRDSEENHARIVDDEQASRDTIVSAALDVGLSELVGDRRALINLSAKGLKRGLAYALPAKHVVLEILETVAASSENLALIEKAASHGYAIALDDFEYSPDKDRLVELAAYVKMDVLHLSDQDLAENSALLLKRGKKLIAEKIENEASFERCRSLGFSYFQGYYFARPEIVTAARVPPTKTAALRLLAKLHDPAATFAEFCDLITKDVTLSYKLLRHTNSAMFARPTKVDSVHRALILLGVTQVRQWASLLVLARVGAAQESLTLTAMIRARMAEILSTSLKRNSSSGFTVGMFSMLDALIGRPLLEVISELPLTDEVAAAILRREGVYGDILRAVMAYEEGAWDRVALAGIPDFAVVEAYVAAVTWAEALMESARG